MQHIGREINIPQNSSQTGQKCPQGGRLKRIRVTTAIMEISNLN